MPRERTRLLPVRRPHLGSVVGRRQPFGVGALVARTTTPFREDGAFVVQLRHVLEIGGGFAHGGGRARRPGGVQVVVAEGRGCGGCPAGGHSHSRPAGDCHANTSTLAADGRHGQSSHLQLVQRPHPIPLQIDGSCVLILGKPFCHQYTSQRFAVGSLESFVLLPILIEARHGMGDAALVDGSEYRQLFLGGAVIVCGVGGGECRLRQGGIGTKRQPLYQRHTGRGIIDRGRPTLDKIHIAFPNQVIVQGIARSPIQCRLVCFGDSIAYIFLAFAIRRSKGFLVLLMHDARLCCRGHVPHGWGRNGHLGSRRACRIPRSFANVEEPEVHGVLAEASHDGAGSIHGGGAFDINAGGHGYVSMDGG
mmetsp:Transcript_3201/g.5840  ORF Transcript_3201/g.5840 Transcript_3201/m.5840 type:complete len:364 (-) Transcript_3201:235-1326(-)